MASGPAVNIAVAVPDIVPGPSPPTHGQASPSPPRTCRATEGQKGCQSQRRQHLVTGAGQTDDTDSRGGAGTSRDHAAGERMPQSRLKISDGHEEKSLAAGDAESRSLALASASASIIAQATLTLAASAPEELERAAAARTSPSGPGSQALSGTSLVFHTPRASRWSTVKSRFLESSESRSRARCRRVSSDLSPSLPFIHF